MNDEAITAILASRHAAAEKAGKNLPHDDIVRALRFLPDCDIWAIGDDGQAIFALLRDALVFTVGFRDSGGVTARSRPLEGRRLLVSLAWDQRQRTETGGMACATQWSFRYEGEREAHDEWQQMTGLVVLDQFGNERLDDREKFARALAATAGWE
jgi:hypothetical protein